MITRIIINRHTIARNKKSINSEDDKPQDLLPPIAVKNYKETRYAHEIEIMGASKIVYDPIKPKSQCSGATVWLETEADVIIVR